MLPLRIALRYLLSRKSHSTVNIISAVAMAGVAVAAAAMIVVLSVFNGFSQLVEKKTSNFNPPLMIKMANSTVISNADSLASVIQNFPSISVASPIIEEQAFALSESGQMPVNIRAMEPVALDASGLQKIIIDGDLIHSQAIISVGVALNLNVRPTPIDALPTAMTYSGWIQIFEPNRTGRVNPANPTTAFHGDSLRVAGVYQVEQEEQDRDMLVIPLSVARDLLDYTTEATAIAVYPTIANIADLQSIEQEISSLLPADMVILDRMGQEADAYRMIAVEKWITFLLLLFILAISSFNIISTLSLMIVEKDKNMGVLAAMGATQSFVKRIFANQGGLITIVGGTIGLIIGSLLTLGQQHFGWIKLSSSNPAVMAIDYYPVSLAVSDLLAVFSAIILTSLIIAAIGAWLARPARRG